MKTYFSNLIIPALALFFFLPGCQPKGNNTDHGQEETSLILEKSGVTSIQKNVIFVLSDDHRYDFMGFTGKVPWLQTPAMDKMAAEGCHLENAFVTTSLCSPSRASILTGMYSHAHTVVDNQAPVPDDLMKLHILGNGIWGMVTMIPGQDLTTGKASKGRGTITNPV